MNKKGLAAFATLGSLGVVALWFYQRDQLWKRQEQQEQLERVTPRTFEEDIAVRQNGNRHEEPV